MKKSKTLTVIPAASVSPTSLKFGIVAVGATGGPLVATVINKGKVPFTVQNIGITRTYASSYAFTENWPLTLAAGGSCTVNVTFKPSVAKSRSAILSIANSVTGTPRTVSLSGTGT
ncbi:MAG: choice-of-anchor D domain-containing protein [Acidobacteria bacterium]|nr:MAG: choice-of-anchor D domain-containing protein [Acidobacteriota bacterium]